MRIRIDYVCRGLTALHVHPHVKRSVVAEGEAPVRRIELVGTHAQVGEDPVQALRRMEEGVVMDKPEVVVYKNEAVVGRGLRKGVGVAVEGHQPAQGGQAREDFAAVPAAAEGGVGVEAVRVEDQGVDAGFQEYGDVVFRHCWPLLFREAQWQ